MAKGTVLVVDDERKISETVALYLERDGYDVVQEGTGDAALKAARPGRCDLVVLDLMLPDLSGEEVAKAIRSISNMPIIMLTAKAQEEDRIAGLQSGADDYMVKPFSPRELVARVDAVLRRTRGEASEPADSYGDGAIQVNRATHQILVDGKPAEVTHTEFDLVVALASRPGRVFSRMELVDRLMGYDYEGYERTVDAHVKNLRHRLGEDTKRPRFVQTVIGVGYRFAPCRDA